MSEAASPSRLLSLDVFRGLTIAGMVLVNNPGTWSAVYPALKHAEWHGWTPTDFVFPFFVFIVGVAIPLALGKRVEQGAMTRDVYLKIVKRSAIIFGLGLIQMGFPFFDVAKTDLPTWAVVLAIVLLVGACVLFAMDRFKESVIVFLAMTAFLAVMYFIDQGFPYDRFAKLRIPGVLQRLALCYLFASLIFLHTKWRLQALIATMLLFIYWMLMYHFGSGGYADYSLEGNFSGMVDRHFLGENHIWKASRFYDPEGILSTIPAVVSCLIGVLCGTWIKSGRESLDKVSGMFVAGVALTAVGWAWSFWFPINKPLWTSSYAVYMGGLALCFLAACMWLVDVKGYVKYWTKPFVIYGMNALALYFASSIFARVLIAIKVDDGSGKSISSQKYVYDTLFAPLAQPIDASLIFALFYVVFWLFLMWLLYRKGIFIKV
jgi:predicted acyltransferase